MEIGKELAFCHAPPFECRCSVLYSIIIIYFIVMSFSITRLTSFFASGFVNVILLQRHVCLCREVNILIFSYSFIERVAVLLMNALANLANDNSF